MKPWLIVVITVEAVLIVALLVLLACLCGTSSTFTENAASSARDGLDKRRAGPLSPLRLIPARLRAALRLIS